MALELSSIVFKASTDELDAAVKKIETLGKSVEGLASSLGKLDKETSDASKTQSQANLNNAKTEAINIKNAKALRDAAAASEELTEATRKRQSVEERQAAITRLMAEGNSRGQASILATAEALGEATEKTNEYLKAQRAMSSNNPFDRSLGAATVFANELKVATVASDLYNKDLGFTKNQLQELGREHVRLTEQFKVQGKSLSGLDAEFNKIVQSAQQVTQAENAMATSMKNGQKATIDAGKANAYIENELQKVRFALQANNEELNRGTSNSLVRFENALKKSGLTLDQQKVKIDEYRRAQIELQKTTSSNQTDYITRAVGPQITDIIVGLSTGQSPLTVMMQQGGQLRDQFGMMGIAAKDMGDVMRNAMKGMAQSVFDTGKAIGSMLVGGIYDAGKAVVNFGLEVTRINSVMDYFKQKLAAQGEEGFKYIGMLNRAGAVVTGVFAVGIAAGVLSVLALGVAFVQVTKAQDDLTKSLVSSGAQLGLSSTDAVTLAESFRGVGATSVEILTAFKQIAESGNISRESLVAVAEAALILENAGGKAASKTIEMFAKLADKPMETLSEYAQKTGLVDQAEMQRIETLVKLGQEITATEEATKILSKATEDEAAIMLASLSDVSRLWLTVKGGISEAWRAVQEFAGSAEVMSVVKVVLQTVAVVATEVWYGIKGIGESLGGLGAIAAAVMTDIKNLDTNFTASKGMMSVIEDQDKARANSYNNSIARIMQEGKYSREELNKTAALAATGRKATADAEKDRVAHELAMKPWREQEQKSLADNLTKQEFIKQAIDKTNKALTEGKTLRAEEIAQITKLAGADWDKSNKPKKAKLSDEQKKENKALEDYIDLMNKAVGLNKDYNNILDGLQLRKKNGKLTEEEYVKAVEELIKQQKFYTDGLAQEEKAQKAAQKAAEDHMKLVQEFAKIQDEFTATSLKNQEGIQQENSALKLRGDLLGKTAEEQKKINENYKAQGDISKINAKYDKERLELQQKYLKLQADGFDVDYDTWNAQINESVRQQGEEAKLVWAGVAMSAAESMQNEFQKSFDAIKSSITDVIVTALFDGGKAGSKKLRDQVVQAFRNKITVVIDAVINTAMQSGMNALGFGGGTSGGSGGSAGMNFLSPNSIADGFGRFAGSGFGQTLGLSNSASIAGNNPSAFIPAGGELTALGSQVQSLASSAGSILSYASALNSLSEGKIGAAAGTALGQYFGGPLGAFIGGKIGSALDEAFAGETRSGASYTSANGKAVFQKGPSGGEIAGKEARIMMENAMSAITDTLKAVGSKATLTGFVAGLESSDKGKGFNYAGGQINGRGFGESLGRDGGQFAMVSQDAKTAFANYGKELSQSILEALQVTEDIPQSLKSMLEGIDIEALTNEETDALLKTVNTLVQSVTGFNDAMLSLPFDYLKNLSFDTAAGLIAAGGGLESLMGNLSGFYDNFYTEAEKTTNLTNNTSAAFAELGIIMPEINQSTRAWYRSEVERLGAMDQSIEANRVAYTSALSLQGAVNTLAPAFDSAAQSAADAAANMTSAWASVMQARGVASSEVTRYTAQASIDAAFTEFKKTDKFDIKTASQFQTITEADFRNYTSSQQQLIATILTGYKSIADANVPVQAEIQNSYREVAQSVDTTASVVKDALETIRENLRTTSASLEIDLLNVKGRTAEAKAAQKAIDTASFSTDEAAMALYNYNQSLKDQISYFGTLKGLQDEYTDLTTTDAQKRNKIWLDLNEKDPTGTLSGLQIAIWDIKDAALAASAALEKQKNITSQVSSLQSEYDDLTLTTAQKRNKIWLAQNELDPTGSISGAQIKVWDKQDEIANAKVLSDYNRALLEATGDTSGLAEFDRAISDAALIASGWTQAQVQAINTAKDKAKADAEVLAEQKAQAQITSDYNRAMLEASGNTSGLAAFDRAISDAALITAGWTQAQVQALNTARNTAAVNAGIGSWQEKVNTQSESGIALNRTIQLNRDLANAMSDTERGLINQYYANEDLATAADKAAQATETLKSAMDSLESARVSVAQAFKSIKDNAENTKKALDASKEAITTGYVNALEQQTQAQEVINDLIRQSAVEMKGFADGIREFLLEMATTDIGADSKITQLKALQDDFYLTAGLAKGGDKAAYGSVTGKASSLLSAGKEQFSTLAEFARFSSKIGNTLSELATIADGKAGPLAEAVDPMIKAQEDLLKANQEVALWSAAISESGASTSLAVTDYLADWRSAKAADDIAQAELKAAQLLTKDIDMQLLDVLGDLRSLIASYNEAKVSVVSAGGAPTVSTAVDTNAIALSNYTQWLATFKNMLGADYNDSRVSGLKQDYWTSYGNAGIPSFAVGTNSVPTDMLANIHKGERIIPEADNTELMQRLSSPMVQDNSELVLEIQRLNNRLATIESNTASTAGHAAKTARLLDRAMPDGDALATREAAAI